MKGSKMVLVGLLALAAPVRAQLQGRDIDLNQKQGRVGYEQAEYFVIEGPPPKGFGGWDGAPKGFPKPDDGKKLKPEDGIPGLLDDPSETTPDPKAKKGPDKPDEPEGTGAEDFTGE